MTGGSDAERRGRSVSVRVRILASILVVSAAGLAVAGGTAYLVQRERTLAGIDEALLTAGADAGAVAQESGAASLEEVLTALVQRVPRGDDQTSLGIVDGAAALTPGGAPPFRLEDVPGFVDRVSGEAARGSAVIGTDASGARSVRYLAVPVTVTGDARAGALVSGVDLGARLRPIDEAFRTFALVAVLAVLATGAVGWFVAGRLLAPLRGLREAAARITASDLSERIPLRGRDDVSELTATVNGMLGRLEGSIASQRRLLDDVGHELGTPITIVRGHLELMDAADPGDVGATRDLALDELDRMSGLVRDISSLAELEGRLVLQRRPVDAAALTEQVLSKAQGLTKAQGPRAGGHAWELDGAAHAVVQVDPERLTQALLQLAANAVRHGSPGGRIRIGSALSRDSGGAGRVAFWVEDDGPGIDPDLQVHLFERFRRGSTGRGSAGSGLGLAIVASIARAHGGTASVSSAPGRGARFTVEVPAERPSDPEGES